jgi:hypothetical protein
MDLGAEKPSSRSGYEEGKIIFTSSISSLDMGGIIEKLENNDTGTTARLLPMVLWVFSHVKGFVNLDVVGSHPVGFEPSSCPILFHGTKIKRKSVLARVVERHTHQDS